MILIDREGKTITEPLRMAPSEKFLRDFGYTTAIITDDEWKFLDEAKENKDIHSPMYHWHRHSAACLDRVERVCKVVTLQEYINGDC